MSISIGRKTIIPPGYLDTLYWQAEFDKRGVNVQKYGAKGDGIADDYASLSSMITALGTTLVDVVFPSGTYKLSSDITFPSTMNLIFLRGAALSPDNTKTVTINGSITAGKHQIFSGAGSINGDIKVTAVLPEWFGAVGDGTTIDTAAVQKAFDLVFKIKSSLLLSDRYNITGGTILINKASDFREPTYIIASNFGGIKKTDAGFMLSSPNTDVSDFVFQNVYFEGNQAVAVKVFDCSKLIRLKTMNCYYKHMTTIMYTDDTKYLQSIRMTGDTIIGCAGAALDFAGAYDTVLTNVLMESSSGYFINHRQLGENPGIYGFRIRDCIIEGLAGTIPAIKFKNVDSLLIDGCYFESNVGGHIVFDPAAQLTHVTISNCRHGGPADVGQLIKWGQVAKGCFSYNNACQNIGIHDATSVTVGRIYSVLDSLTAGGGLDLNPNNRIDYVKYSEAASSSTGVGAGYRTVFGGITRLTSTVTNKLITAGATVKVTFPFAENIYSDDTISLQVFALDKKITVNHFYRDPTTKTNVYALITNNEATDQTISSIRMTVLKLNSSNIEG